MFYISNISGSQIPYDAETFRAGREVEQLAQARSAEVEGAGLTSDRTASTTRSGEQTSQASGSQQHQASNSEIGMAGATVIHRSQSGGEASEASLSQQPSHPSDQQDHPVSSVKASHAVEADSEEPTKKRKSPLRIARPVNPYEKMDNTPPQREPAVRAEQIMTSPVVSLKPDQTMDEAWQVISVRRFRHVPVASADGKLVGIVSDRDFISTHSPLAVDFFNTKNIYQRPISEVMATNVLSARPETPIRDIARIMFEERIGAMPIVNDDEVLVGLLTRSDILRTVVNMAPLQLWT